MRPGTTVTYIDPAGGVPVAAQGVVWSKAPGVSRLWVRPDGTQRLVEIQVPPPRMLAHPRRVDTGDLVEWARCKRNLWDPPARNAAGR